MINLQIWFSVWVRENLYGLKPEGFLVLFLGIFMCVIVVMRYFLCRYSDNSLDVVDYGSNRVSAFVGFCALIIYYSTLYNSPIFFQNYEFSVYSDGGIYLFRLILGALFLIYYLYVVFTTLPYSGYKFEYYFVLVGTFVALNLMLISADFFILFFGGGFCFLMLYHLLGSWRFSNTNSVAFNTFLFLAFLGLLAFIFGFIILYCADDNYGRVFSILEEITFFLECLGYLFIIAALFLISAAGSFYFLILPAREGVSFPILILLTIFVQPVFALVCARVAVFSGSSFVLYFFLGCMSLLSLFGLFGAISSVRSIKFFIYVSIYNIGFLGIFFQNSATLAFSCFILFFSFYAANFLGFLLIFCSFRCGLRKLQFPEWVDVCTSASRRPLERFSIVFFVFFLTGLPPFSPSFFFCCYFFRKLFSGSSFVLLVALGVYLLIILLFSCLLFVGLYKYVKTDVGPLEGYKVFWRGLTPLVLGFLTPFNLFFFFFFLQLLSFVNLFTGSVF